MAATDAVTQILGFLTRELQRARVAEGVTHSEACCSRLHEAENVLNVCLRIKEKYMTKPTFKFELTHPDAKLPTKNNPSDSGWDVYACEETVLMPGKPVICKTGLRCSLPAGYELQVRSRSGLAAKSGVFVLNSPGTIDNLFRGSVGVILTSVSDSPYIVKVGDRIAQLVPAKVEDVSFAQVESVDTNTERGSDGFGSSGT